MIDGNETILYLRSDLLKWSLTCLLLFEVFFVPSSVFKESEVDNTSLSKSPKARDLMASVHLCLDLCSHPTSRSDLSTSSLCRERGIS